MVIYYIKWLVRSPDFVNQLRLCTSFCAELWCFLPMNASCELVEMASVYLEHQELERRWVKDPLAIETIEPNRKKPKEFSQKDVKRKGSTKSHDIATSWLVETWMIFADVSCHLKPGTLTAQFGIHPNNGSHGRQANHVSVVSDVLRRQVARRNTHFFCRAGSLWHLKALWLAWECRNVRWKRLS